MKIRDLMEKLAALNPEAEVFTGVGHCAVGGIYHGEIVKPLPVYAYLRVEGDASPSDTLIVLSE